MESSVLTRANVQLRPCGSGRPHWWTPSASLHARLGISAAACYFVMAGFSLKALPVVKIKSKAGEPAQGFFCPAINHSLLRLLSV